MTDRRLPYYPHDVPLTGVEYSPAMLELARRRADELARKVDLREGDAHALDFPDGSFDTVVCTYGLCAIPDDKNAIEEMWRVLRTGGLLLLADHVAGSSRPVRAVQEALEWVTVPQASEHFLRRPRDTALAVGFEIERRERFTLGIVERIAARRPAPPHPTGTSP